MKTIRTLLLTLLVAGAVFGQATLTSTTLSAAADNKQTTITVASATGITLSNTTSGFSTSPTILYVDREQMLVTGAPVGTVVPVQRGWGGSIQVAHVSGATVYVGPAPYFYKNPDPSGSCTAASEIVLPHVNTDTGNIWTCPTSGPSSGIWTMQGSASSFTFTDGAFFLPPSACVSSVSGNGTGTNGLTTVGASVTPVMQAQTTATGTNTHTYVCQITVPARLTALKGIAITDVTFFYGVQTTALGTQVATLASGTMNSSLVFSKIALPVAAASETASTVTPVRADSGTLVITPVVASFNTGTTTAGAFFSVKFTPASAIAMTTDLQTLLLTVSLLNTATSATITNTPGLLVHYTAVPL